MCKPDEVAVQALKDVLLRQPGNQKCFMCGAAVASNVQMERVSGMCDECICDHPEVFEERYSAAIEKLA